MRIILDENVPLPLAAHLAPHEVTTVQEQNWAGLQNGDLLPHLEGQFDVFVLADKNMRYQQNLTSRTIAFVELHQSLAFALATDSTNYCCGEKCKGGVLHGD